MKKNKIFGLLIALGGMVASFATAAALYTKKVDPVGFGIGAQFSTQDGSITYLIGGKTDGKINGEYLDELGNNHGSGLGGDAGENKHYTQVHFEFPLSATYTQKAQDYVVGNFSVSLSGIATQLQNKAKIWIELKGFGSEYYQEGTEAANYKPDHSSVWGSSAANVKFMNSDELITGASYSKNKDIAVETAGGQSVHVYFKLITANPNTEAGEQAFDFADMLSLAETSPFTMSVSWGAVSQGYERAYCIGDGTNWKVDELYAMVPNLKSATYQWYFKGVSGWTAGKVIKPVAEGDDVWSAGGDATLVAGTTYNVFWDDNGGELAAASYNPVQA